MERLSHDGGLVDWAEFGGLLMEARSSYYKSLFKTIDLSDYNRLGKEEMDTILAQVNEAGKKEIGKSLEELFFIMLNNFDERGDGTINIVDFINAIPKLKF